MSFLLPVILVVVFVAVLAMLLRGGIWSNAIALLNGVIAAILATNYHENLANLLTSMAPSYVYLLDMASLWILFAVFYLMLRGVTDYLSKTRPRITKIVDQGGGVVLAVWLGWVMVCFTAFSLHTAPLAREFLGGGFDPESRMFFGTAPDRQWLAFMQKVSRTSWGDAETDEDIFDPHSDFMIRHATRRARFETIPSLVVQEEK